jgi:sarcosine oxidase delta subunit
VADQNEDVTPGGSADDEPDVEYLESCDLAWTEAAYEALIAGRLHGEVSLNESVLTSRVWGPCPRCGHEIDDRQTHTAVTDAHAVRRQDAPVVVAGDADKFVFVPVDVTCSCDSTTHGAPAHKKGCGASFRVELPLSASESRQQ